MAKPADPVLDMLLEEALPVALAGCENETALGAALMFGAWPPLSRTVNVEPRPWCTGRCGISEAAEQAQQRGGRARPVRRLLRLLFGGRVFDGGHGSSGATVPS